MGVRVRTYTVAFLVILPFLVILITSLTAFEAEDSGAAALLAILSGFGALASAIGFFVISSSMVRPLETIAMVSRHYAAGNFRERLEEIGVPEVDSISSSFNEVADSMRKLAADLHAEVNQLQRSSLELKDASDAVVGSTVAIEERASNNATASEEMSVTIENVARNAEAAAKGATNARQLAENGSLAVENTRTQVHRAESQIEQSASVVSELAELSTKISIVVRFISDIADETNLLALNAAIEAARAGEHGRGFAVVADEVRKLAEATMNSTKEISATVESIQSGATRAKKAMESVRDSIGAVSSRADDTADALNAIFAANREIENMVLSISTASEEQSTTSVDMARNIEETAQEAEQLSSCGNLLPEVANQMTGISTQLTRLASKLAEGHADTVNFTSFRRGSSVRKRQR